MADVVRVNSIEAIAKGGVGCIVTPALQCIDHPEPNDRTRISKIFTNVWEYQEEFASSEELEKRLADVKNRSNFFLYKATNCLLDPVQKERLKKENNKASIEGLCPTLNKPETDIYVLNYDYGGESIENILEKSLTIDIINNVLLNLHNLFQGVIILNKHLIYHLDLSTDNVLLSLNGKMKIIDFGRCFIAEENSFNEKDITRHFSKNGTNFGKAMYVAPELLATIKGGEYMMYDTRFKNEFYNDHNIDIDFIKSIRKGITSGTTSLKDCFEKADVWALGVILHTIRKKINKQNKSFYNKALDYLIDNFTHIDFKERANPSQAYILYKTFVRGFRRLMKRVLPLLTSSPTSSPELSTFFTDFTDFTLSPKTSPKTSPTLVMKEVGGKRIKRKKTKKIRNKKRRKLTRRI